MSENQQPLLPIPLEPILEIAKEKVPRMIATRDKAVAAMRDFYTKFKDALEKYKADPEGLKDTMDGLVTEGNDLLAKIKTTYDGVVPMRKSMTDSMDSLKEWLMQFEKELAYDAKANNGYNAIKGLIQLYKQAELDARKKAEEEAAKKRERENYKVDLAGSMRKNLLDLLATKLERANTESRKYLYDCPIEEFEARVTAFMKMTPKLKQEDYDKCFSIFFDKNKITEQEFAELQTKVKSDDSYEKWTQKIVQELTPIVNEWRAKIPEIRRERNEIANADATTKAELEKKQQEHAIAEDNRIKMSTQAVISAEASVIDQRAEVEKTKNSFVEQATTQQLEDTGPSKKVLKFSEKSEDQMQALISIMAHCMMHKKFPGIYKKDKEPKEYIDSVGWWVRFFETNCKDKTVEGATWEDVAKVIVRK